MNYKNLSLDRHYEWRGKIEVVSRVSVNNADDLSVAYTPGVAEPCLAIRDDVSKSFDLTRRGELIAVITDGSAVLGLGDIGPEAGMPVMEGKCALFKEFGGVDAFPVCVRTKDIDEFVRTVYLISGSFGGINLEDIAAPRCFEIEQRLQEICDIPIFHDDQHGTAVVVLAALINSLKIVGKSINNIKIVVNGVGAAGTAIAKQLLSVGVSNILLINKDGIIYKGKPGLTSVQAELADATNSDRISGTLDDAISGADVFIGVSVANVLTEDMVKKMNSDAIVFAMANPDPEIDPVDAERAGARIVGTGRSDYKNQINNVLAFPGIFRGALDCRASVINEQMKLAAAYAIANLINNDDLNENNILPKAFDRRVTTAVAAAVKQAAISSGVAQKK